MTDLQKTEPQAALRSRQTPGRIIGLAGVLLGLFALATPLLPGKLAFLVLGFLILVFGLLQNFAGFALRDSSAEGSWFSRGGGSILTGLLLMAMPNLTFAGLAILLGLSWMVSGASEAAEAIRHREETDWYWSLADGLVSMVLGLAIAVQWPISGIVSIGLYVGLRFLSVGWSGLIGSSQLAGPTISEARNLHPNIRLGLAPHPYVEKLRSELELEEAVRNRSDRGWRWLFLLMFFAIHASRMDIDWNLVGMLAPAGAVAGDVVLAILLAYGIAAPLTVSWRAMTRPVERRAWARYLAAVDQDKARSFRLRLRRWWLVRRMRAAVRHNQATGSPTAALGWGFQTGLPAVAILMAVTPLWGVSWFFDSETWVTGAWEMWAEQRTDTWRTNMVAAVKREHGATAADNPDFFRVFPAGFDDVPDGVDDDGVAGAGDFSFVVIGDTGEGDASQHILRDQLLQVGQKPEVKFLVLSSDVIYPSGAMKDYQPKFYLPFKGFHKPIYAVPGNHDWYDALESFAANFFEPAAARAALRGRREADHKLTTTTESRIDSMVAEAHRLRQEYQIQAAQQRATYFEILTDRFSLIAVDTGILRRVDDDQMRWLVGALKRAGDRFKMVILGHPLYAAGHYQGEVEVAFAELHRVLRQHAVNVVMGGDTHDFEFYKEDYESDGSSRSMYHFVNGGGGAYLSIGTALAWPEQPAVAECGFYPRADALVEIIEARTTPLKWPLWMWVKHLGAWPSSPEVVASAFNYDRAPFYQSFMEVRVEGSTGTVRLWLYGANGRLRWRDLHVQGQRIPGGQAAEDLVEFSFRL